METMYQKKQTIMENVMNHVDNGRLPIISMAQTWAIAYAGGTAEECKQDPVRECEIYGKHLKDMYFDSVLMFGLNAPLWAFDGLGYQPLFISNDGITLQCSQGEMLIRDDEVERFIQNPMAFLREVALPRRYIGLRGTDEENLAQLKRSVMGILDFIGRWPIRRAYLEKECQTPMLMGSAMLSPAFDQYFQYRGIVKGLTDMRRRPQQVLDACEAMIPMLSGQPEGSFPWAFNPIVSATYLSTNQFEKFFWPSYKKQYEPFIQQGGKVIAYLEGTWGEKVAFFNEFPANSFVVCLEGDDYFQVADKIGDKVAIAYPFPLALLKNGTVEEVKTEAMRIIDRIGTKGTAMAVDKCLLSLNDAKPENYAALSEVCRTYHP